MYLYSIFHACQKDDNANTSENCSHDSTVYSYKVLGKGDFIVFPGTPDEYIVVKSRHYVIPGGKPSDSLAQGQVIGEVFVKENEPS